MNKLPKRVNTQKPNFRFGTKQAIDELAKELNIFNDNSLQDWAYISANEQDIEKYAETFAIIKEKNGDMMPFKKY